ncbi:MAG: hypothetical protein IJC98_04845 [Clostridia bacterium]|nr:hypothetical protein [Clostridia bacterium]
MYRPVPFVRIDGDFSDEENMTALLQSLKKAGYGGIAPIPIADGKDESSTAPAFASDGYFGAYELLLKKAQKLDMQIVYCDDALSPSGSFAGSVKQKYPDACAYILKMYEYVCASGEVTHRKLDTNGITLSLTAYEVDTGECIDLRSEMVGDTLVWNTPHGNWNILQFTCEPNPDSDHVNLLDYNASMKFVELSYKSFTDRFSQYIGKVVKSTFSRELQYLSKNRRMWSPDFNEYFFKEFGYDPAPYYPALFFDIGPKTEYYTACFMKCRAQMLVSGFFKAVYDFTSKFDLQSTITLTEPKTAACSNLIGDALQAAQYEHAVGVDLSHAFMYGFNGIKLMSSAAYNYEKEMVIGQIFNNYTTLDKKVIYKDAMNAFVRGVNCLMPDAIHWSDRASVPSISPRNPLFKDLYPKFTDFLSRCHAMLQGGTHVCDVALLYPIDSLHSNVFFFSTKTEQYEFPEVLPFADYISNINSIMNYCAQDLTVLHPDILLKNGRTENGILYLDNHLNPEQYRILVLPAMTITSIRILRFLRDFYDCGGKILATSKLPFKLTEDDDLLRKEAAEIIEYLFGEKEDVINYVSDYEIHTNEKGGMAVFLRSSTTDLDGTEHVEATRIAQVFRKFDVPADIVFERFPRIPNSGALSLHIPAFRNYLNNGGLTSGGVFNYLHKRHDNCEVYYISNTTVKDYSGYIDIKGCFDIEEWNPHTGKIRPLSAAFCSVKQDIYSCVDVAIPSDSSVFLVCRPKEKIPDAIRSFDDLSAMHQAKNEIPVKKTPQRKTSIFGRS